MGIAMMREKMNREHLCCPPTIHAPHITPQRLLGVVAAVACLAMLGWNVSAIAQTPPSTRPAADTNAPAGPDGFSPEAVEKAVKKGIEYLKKSQGADGSWPAYGDYTVAPTAIATYAMLESGMIKVVAPEMKSALDWLGKRQIPVRMLRGPHPGAPATAGSTDIFCHKTYELGLRANAFLAAMERSGTWNSPYRPFLKSDVIMLVLSTADGSYGDDCFGDGKSSGDNFNSLYGLFGVWACVQADMEVPRAYWHKVLKHWQECQNPDGGWGVQNGLPSTAATTAGGMAAISLCFDNLLADGFVKCDQGPGVQAVLRPLNTGLAWMDKNLQPALADPNGALAGPAGLYPFLHAVHYAGQVTGRKYLGGTDWYKLGAAELLRRQRPDGSWAGKDGPHADTAYAMFFLLAERNPVVFNKLQYDGDWNNRPQDLARLIRWPVPELCGWPPLRWQVVPINASVEQWHDAPVLYIAGAKDPNFSAGDVDKLRSYVQQGGTIMSVRECDGKGFGEGIRRAYAKMFPEYRMQPIEADHRILSVNYKIKAREGLFEITNGVRTLAVHSDIDMSRSWQLSSRMSARDDFEFVFNALLYVTDYRTVYRGQVELPLWPTVPARAPARTIQLARLRYDGNWDPEPLAWERFGRLLTAERAVGVDAKPTEIDKLPACGARVAHLAGTAAIALSAEQRAAIKKFVERGGTLLIDAAGGSTEFANSASKMLGEMFGPSSLQRLKPDAAIYNLSEMKIDAVRYTRRAAAMELTVSTTGPPYIRGITIDGRVAVMFSDVDITTGLLGIEAFECAGYRPKSAFEIARNVLLYATDKAAVESPKK
jgi:hypothetical protein